ncbi:MAG: YgcG family protein [Leptospirales bacterium]|nr:YgcG family protein [Leptospirales bacterium]
MKLTCRVLLNTVCATLSFGILHAQELAEIPDLRRRVTDTTGTLSSQDIASIEAKLAGLEKTKGSQIAVLVVPTVKPESIEQYGIRVAEKWKVGRAKVDDGAILIIAKQDRKLRIEVGYGLEGALSDAVTKRIIDRQIVPFFKKQDYAGGISAGVDAMISVVNGEPLPEPKGEATSGHSSSFSRGPLSGRGAPGFVVLLVITVIIGSVLTSWLSKITAGISAGAIGGFVGWLFMGLTLGAVLGVVGMLATWFFASRGGSGGSSGWSGGSSDWSSGSSWGSSDSSSSSDWSGGGGDFGGGGSSGSW